MMGKQCMAGFETFDSQGSLLGELERQTRSAEAIEGWPERRRRAPVTSEESLLEETGKCVRNTLKKY
jgi:hypothetical protein